MRGRFGTQRFFVEKRRSIGCRLNEVFLLLRWATRSPPHPSPSVTASPQGEASGLCSPTRKSAPNQGTYMGTVPAPPPGQCATTAKTSEWQRAGYKKGGAGGIPPRLFASGLSLEKAWIPAPDRGGGPRRRVEPAMVLTGPPADTGRPPGPTWQVSPCTGRPCRHVPLSLRRRPRRSPRSWTGCGPGIPPGPRPSAAAARRAGRPSQ